MRYTDKSCRDFAEVLASKAPVPGGGGASALAGSLAAALGNMVGNLTSGKKKYKDVQSDIEALNQEADNLRIKLLDLVEEDAEMFEPLSKAYGLPSETSEEKAHKAEVMEKALVTACTAPLEIMRICCRVIELQAEYAEKGSVLATSDAGAGAIIAKSALQGASLNVYINTGMMKNREEADRISKKADIMLEKYTKEADKIFDFVMEKIKK